MNRWSITLRGIALGAIAAWAQAGNTHSDATKARVFITDSQSWEIGGYSGGAGGAGGSTVRGGARPQTAEIIKTFSERCPQVAVNNIQTKVDYIVLLDHEGGKSFVRHKNKVAVFARISGDSIIAKSTLSVGGSVQEACTAITADWSAHSAAIRTLTSAPPARLAATLSVPQAPANPIAASSGKLSIRCLPEGAEIELDGSFAGNAPSEIVVLSGEHRISVKKAGFKTWERKLMIGAGSAVTINVELETL